jgi:DNA invertase Pin-like site-specific DNA recombinase
MRLGYIRIDRAGPSREDQRAALGAAGISDFTPDGPVYVDEAPKRRPKPGVDLLPARTDALKALRQGDELAIHSPARLGSSRGEVLAALEAIGKAGASIYDCASGKVIPVHPDAALAIGFAAEAESQGQRERAARARRGKVRHAGPPPALTGKRLIQAGEAWADPAKSAEQVAKEVDASVSTLYRRFGNREAHMTKKGTKA